MQESRLFKIIYYLLDNGRATAPELAERLEVSVRTIYRDIEALSGAGIPVYTEAGRRGGIYLLSGFVLNKAVLSQHEQQEILSALQGLSVLNGVYKGDVLEKLSAIFNVNFTDWLEVDFSRWGEIPGDNDKFEMIKTAIIHNRCMKIFYANSYGSADERVVQPLKLYYKSKDWYLKAYCRLKQDFRLFKLNRILKWELTGEQFAPISFPEVQDAQQQAGITITLRFPGEMAYRVYDEFALNQVKSDKSGSITVTASMPEDDWIIGYILSFGAQVEIIEPAYLKKIVAEKAKEIYEKNKT